MIADNAAKMSERLKMNQNLFELVNLNTLVGMLAAAIAVFVGVNIKHIGVRMFVLVLMTAVLSAAAVIETWFIGSSLMKSAAVGWFIGYITDDVLLTFNALMPDFVKDALNRVLNGIKLKIDKWFS